MEQTTNNQQDEESPRQEQPQTQTSAANNEPRSLDFHQHDRQLRKGRLYTRIVTAVIVALVIILFCARGPKVQAARRAACEEYIEHQRELDREFYDKYYGDEEFYDRYSDPSYRNSYHCPDYYYYQDYPEYDLVSLPILGVAMLWNIAEFITYCVNKRGAHPGVHVGMDLFVFLFLLLPSIIAVLRFAVINDRSQDGGIGVAAAAIEVIACFLHLALFIMACVATHRRRMLYRKHLENLHSQLI